MAGIFNRNHLITLHNILILFIFTSAPALYADTSLEEKIKDLENRIKSLEKVVYEHKVTETAEFKERKEKFDEESYSKKIKLYDLEAKYMESLLDGKVPGVTFKLKNEGDKSLSRVEVTVYFLDKDNNSIYEESFYPVNTEGMFSDSKPLKPNYVWRMERGKFYSAKSAPDEWKSGNAKAEVTSVKFLKDQ